MTGKIRFTRIHLTSVHLRRTSCFRNLCWKTVMREMMAITDGWPPVECMSPMHLCDNATISFVCFRLLTFFCIFFFLQTGDYYTSGFVWGQQKTMAWGNGWKRASKNLFLKPSGQLYQTNVFIVWSHQHVESCDTLYIKIVNYGESFPQ